MQPPVWSSYVDRVTLSSSLTLTPFSRNRLVQGATPGNLFLCLSIGTLPDSLTPPGIVVAFDRLEFRADRSFRLWSPYTCAPDAGCPVDGNLSSDGQVSLAGCAGR